MRQKTAAIVVIGNEILTGKSPRGNFNHAVVAYNGEVVHDPHPIGGGVESFVDAIWGVRKD